MHERLSLWIAGVLCAMTIQTAKAENVFEPALDREPAAGAFEESTTNGFLIANGRFVSPPYLLRVEDDENLMINETAFRIESRSGFSNRPDFTGRPGQAGRGWRRGRGGRGSVRSQAARVYGMLESGGLVILSEEQNLVELYSRSYLYDIVDALLDESDAKIESIPDSIRSRLPELRSDAALMTRAEDFQSVAEEIEQNNLRSVQSVLWLDRAAYPLTTLGMLLVVLATGQLLINRPPQGKELNKHSDESSSSTIRFVTMIVAFSILDLIWTILASHDGSMRELNPIGSHLISDPRLLVLFKASTTGVAVAILIYLRRIQRVHLASWWMCLLLTLLTARWLVFNSLLV